MYKRQLLLLVLTIPSGPETEKKMMKDAASGTEAVLQEGLVTEAGEPVAAAANADRTYEQQLEQRVKQILKTVDGVGTAEYLAAWDEKDALRHGHNGEMLRVTLLHG